MHCKDIVTLCYFKQNCSSYQAYLHNFLLCLLPLNCKFHSPCYYLSSAVGVLSICITSYIRAEIKMFAVPLCLQASEARLIKLAESFCVNIDYSASPVSDIPNLSCIFPVKHCSPGMDKSRNSKPNDPLFMLL